MKKRVRIKDIADKAGVSTGTVDRVLHDRGKVAAAVKKRVLEVMDELGYERNLIASALAYNKTIRIAVLLPDPSKDPYWKQTDEGAQKALKAVQHYGLLATRFYFDSFDPKHFLSQAKKALSEEIQGVLFPPLFAEEARWLLEETAGKGIASAMINTQLEGGKPLCYIGQDSYQSGILGARLLDFGLDNAQTACILNLDFSTKAAHHLHKKEAGVRAYFEQNSKKKINIIRSDFEHFNDIKALQIFVDALLNKHPDLYGIFVTNSRAYKLVDALEHLTDRPIKIVGFDLIKPNLNYLKQQKIHFLINQNPVEQGYEGVMSLFKHLLLKEAIAPLQHLPLDIVVQENVEYYLNRHITLEVV